jgi:hypothetical protein
MRSLIPRFLSCQQLGKLWLKHTELVSPRVAQYPKVESAFRLMIPPGGAKRFKTANFGFNVVGLQVKVHAFFGGLFVAGLLEKDSYLRVRDTEPAVYVAAIFTQGFFGSIKCRRPERNTLIKVRNVNDKVAETAAMH